MPITQPGALASAYLQIQIAMCDGTRDPVSWATACVAAMGGERAPAIAAVLASPRAAAFVPRRVSVAVRAHRVERDERVFQRHVVYLLAVALGEFRWEVARRFSDFQRLNDELRAEYPVSMKGAATQLPAKELLPTLRDKELEASRRMPQLQQYLQWLLLSDDTRRSEQLMGFLEVLSRGHAHVWLQSVGSVGGQNAAAVAFENTTPMMSAATSSSRLFLP